MGPQRDGFTLIEMMIVVAILGVAAAVATPGMARWARDQRAKSAARSVANAIMETRSEAIRTGNNHIVFFQQDAQDNTLVDGAANPVPVLFINDDRPGAALQNCRIDAGETLGIVPAQDGMSWGVSEASVRVPTDYGTGAIATGSSFTEPNGDPATWVAFRPDGAPLAFAPDCTLGPVGRGAGALYVTSGERDYAIVLTPLGGVRLHSWDGAAGRWTD